LKESYWKQLPKELPEDEGKAYIILNRDKVLSPLKAIKGDAICYSELF
jgi:hypothetical protein